MAENPWKYGKMYLTKFGRLTEKEIKEQAKIVLKLLFVTRTWVLKENKENYQMEWNSKNVFNLILVPLVGRECPKICWRWICQTSSSYCK